MREQTAEDRFFVEGEGVTALWSALRRQLSAAGRKRVPPIWRESRAFYELATLWRDPLWAGAGLPPGHGLPVFLIPGYMVGDGLLAPIARALSAAGYRPAASGIWLNVGCASDMFGKLEARLAAHVSENGGKRAFVIGQSRGGGFGRWLATRRPDLVAGLVTLGTPLRDPLALHPLILANIGVVSALGTLGIPGLLSTRCMRLDRCCGPVWRELRKPLATGLPFLSIYSRSDGIVDWRSCFDPAARHFEVDASHCGMAFNVDALRAIGAELGHVVANTRSASDPSRAR